MRPFLHTGIYFIGHLWIQVKGKRKKMYILLFTCLNIRAIHLELVKDMSIHSVIFALVQFFTLYEVPSHIYSDNARAFVAGGNLVKQVFVSDEFVGKFSTFNIKHLTIPLYSAWFGSVWMWLIKSVKCCLFKIVDRKYVEYFEFSNLLSDVQNALNSLSLTYRCSEDAGLDIITPNTFLHPHFNTALSCEIQKRFLSWPLLPEKLCWSVWRSGTSIWRNSMTYSIRNTCWALGSLSGRLWVSRVGDCSRGRSEGSLFNSYYYNKVWGRALLLSLDCSTLPSIRTLYCWVLSNEVSSTILKS